MSRVPVPPPETRIIQDRFEACVYRKGQIARCPARAPTQSLTPEQLDLLLNEGDQRVGSTVFRTECPFCRACEPVRIDVPAFQRTKSFRRNFARNDADIRVEVGTPSLSRRRVALWNRHRRARGLLTHYSRKDPVGYQEWLVDSCAPTVEVSYYLEDRLVGVSLLDLGAGSANSAYHYFDPSEAHRGIGTFSVLKEIELCASMGIRWYYLGLWASDAKALRYKSGFYPHERLIGGEWVRFERRDDDPAALDPEGYAAQCGPMRSPGEAFAVLAPMLFDEDDSAGEPLGDPGAEPPGFVDFRNPTLVNGGSDDEDLND